MKLPAALRAGRSVSKGQGRVLSRWALHRNLQRIVQPTGAETPSWRDHPGSGLPAYPWRTVFSSLRLRFRATFIARNISGLTL